jgi:hypothetical protein
MRESEVQIGNCGLNLNPGPEVRACVRWRHFLKQCGQGSAWLLPKRVSRNTRPPTHVPQPTKTCDKVLG